MTHPLDVAIIGGGMYTCDVLLPTAYHLRRTGLIRDLHICARHSTPLRALRDDATLLEAFPDQSFTAHPAFDTPPDRYTPDGYRDLIASLPPRQAVVVATPDHVHYDMVKCALEHDQHVVSVKPLVLHYQQAEELGALAAARGLFVGVEYHKRFDRRALEARRRYAQGHFGDFALGEARLIEPYYYRHSNFQTWFTCANTDPFVYVGCHYVDLVYFITGLRPVSVSVEGVKKCFPNGNEAFMWSLGRVRFENGALLSVANGLGYPDLGGGGNDQGLMMLFEGNDQAGVLRHQDQFRGVEHGYVDERVKKFAYVNPDFFRLLPWEGPGFKPSGYGYDSVAENLAAIRDLESATAGLAPAAALAARQERLAAIDARGLLATPANSYINELVVEAGRASILADGKLVHIRYDGTPRIEI